MPTDIRVLKLPNAARLLDTDDPTGTRYQQVVKRVLGCVGLYGLHWLEFWAREHEASLGGWWRVKVPATLRGIAYAGVTLALIGLHGRAQDFIYFKF